MSQFDFGTIDPSTKTGTVLAGDLNSFRNAVNSSHKGSSRPAYAQSGTMWVNDAVNPWVVYIYDGADDVSIGSVDTTTNTFTPSGAITTAGNQTITGVKTLSGVAINESEGSAIASSATINLDSASGNFVHITGTVGITAITLSQGARRVVVFDAALTLTNGANLILPGGANITTSAGDSAEFWGEGSGVVRCVSYTMVSGQSVVSPTTLSIASTAEAQAGTDNTKAISPLRLREGINAAGSAPIYACRAWVNFSGTGTVTIRASGNVSSITDNGVGDYTVNFTTAMPDANYGFSGICSDAVINTSASVVNPTGSADYATGSIRVHASTTAVGAYDPDVINISVFR